MAPEIIRAPERAARDREGRGEHPNGPRTHAAAHRAIQSILFPVPTAHRIRSESRSRASQVFRGTRTFRVHPQGGTTRHPRPTEQLPSYARDQLREPKVRHDKLDSPLS